jgi:ubiquinone/menaquinone biosynthesis C-methylase UbiE
MSLVATPLATLSLDALPLDILSLDAAALAIPAKAVDLTVSHVNALYTDLSCYYDLMCADIDYQAQSAYVKRLHQIFGNNNHQYLDLACGTGPHVRHFIDFGYHCSGLDINQPMLDIAQHRCPEADFSQGDMSEFSLETQVDLISCFLYSIHYNDGIAKLNTCLASIYAALAVGGMFCFNSVDKDSIDNRLQVSHSLVKDNQHFVFQSGWYYSGDGDKQALNLSIDKSDDSHTQSWQDQHPMVAVNFERMQQLLAPYFEVHIFEHDYDKIVPWNGQSGNAIFACIKK